MLDKEDKIDKANNNIVHILDEQPKISRLK